MKIDSIKIFGERHTGTNALNLFIRENFDLTFKHYDFLGWKHRLAPKKSEWVKYDTANTLFIFLFRNPYSWLCSMYREPYYHHYLKINDRPFEEFLKFSIEDYENIICLWNQKNESYYGFLFIDPVVQCFFIKVRKTLKKNVKFFYKKSVTRFFFQKFTCKHWR